MIINIYFSIIYKYISNLYLYIYNTSNIYIYMYKGIELWHLSLPNWADRVKVSNRKKFLKPRLKTILCKDWVAARGTII